MLLKSMTLLRIALAGTTAKSNIPIKPPNGGQGFFARRRCPAYDFLRVDNHVHERKEEYEVDRVQKSNFV